VIERALTELRVTILSFGQINFVSLIFLLVTVLNFEKDVRHMFTLCS